jgi:hypothetical protein
VVTQQVTEAATLYVGRCGLLSAPHVGLFAVRRRNEWIVRVRVDGIEVTATQEARIEGARCGKSEGQDFGRLSELLTDKKRKHASDL